jgi:hypothetical protein
VFFLDIPFYRTRDAQKRAVIVLGDEARRTLFSGAAGGGEHDPAERSAV